MPASKKKTLYNTKLTPISCLYCRNLATQYPWETCRSIRSTKPSRWNAGKYPTSCATYDLTTFQGFWINYIVDRTIDPVGPRQWLIPIGLQLVPGVIFLIVSLFAPESPRWLCKKDNWDQARKNLIYLRNLPGDHEYITEELSGIKEQIELERAKSGGETLKAKFKEMSLKGNRNRVAIGLLLMACQNLTGVNVCTPV